VTEAQWLAENDPTPLLMFLRDRGEPRRLWLFAVACCRHFRQVIETDFGRNIVEAVERHADGILPYTAIRTAVLALNRFLRSDVPSSILYLNSSLVGAFGGPYAWAAAWKVDDYTRRVIRMTGRNGCKENAFRADVVRCIFINPFRPRPTIDPDWLRWNDGTVPRLARSIYDERRFGDLPILHDALLDAGCDDSNILDHCKDPGPHVRGCWVLDLLLAKE
jgi:hypothetical protein